MRPIDADKLEAKCKEIIAQEREYGTATVSWAHAYESFLDMLETTPTIEPQRWIPVTERLPDFHMNEDGCICTIGKVVFRVVSTHMPLSVCV